MLASGCLHAAAKACADTQTEFGVIALIPNGDEIVITANIRVFDIDADGGRDILVTEPLSNRTLWIHDCEVSCISTQLKDGMEQPVRTDVADLDGDGLNDIIIADIGILWPVDDKVGRILFLRNMGDGSFNTEVLLEDVGRLVCAEAADLDQDGDLDLTVCEFGDQEGSIGWLEQKENFSWVHHILDPRPGAIHAEPFDFDGDGDLDIAVTLSQLSEEILLFNNNGSGGFTKEVLFKATNTYYGMSGLELVDLDLDGDMDILFTNGDTLDWDIPTGMDPNTIHGLAWLENDGTGAFTHHDLLRHWGAYAAKAKDVDSDGDLDILLIAFQLETLFPGVRTQSMVWLENQGDEEFREHFIDAAPKNLITIELADIDGDGSAEFLIGSHNPGGTNEGYRIARVSTTQVEDC
jgi:hypothetical protein